MTIFGKKNIIQNRKRLITQPKHIHDQGFTQALLLISVFHEGLSFMAVGHNATCINMLTLAARGSRVHCKPPPPSPLGIQGQRP